MLVKFGFLVFTVPWQPILCVLHLLSPPGYLLDADLVLLPSYFELSHCPFPYRFVLDFDHLVNHRKLIIDIPHNRLTLMFKDSFVFMDSGLGILYFFNLILEISDIFLVVLSNLVLGFVAWGYCMVLMGCTAI